MKDFIKRNVNKNKLVSILVLAFILGLVFHGYRYFNAMYSHDSAGEIFSSSKYNMIGLGRYIRPVYRLIKGRFALPLLNGLLSILYFGLSSYLITDILDLKKKSSIIFTTAIIITNYSITTLNATYVHDVDSYALSLLLASIGVWITTKFPKGIYCSVIFYVLSLGLYQAYINVPIFLFLILAIKKLINKKDIKEIFIELLKSLVSIAISMVLFYVIWKLVLLAYNIPPSTQYNSTDNALNINIQNLVERFYKTIISQVEWITKPKCSNLIIILCVNLFLFVSALYLLVKLVISNRLDVNHIISIIFIVVLMPFGINTITFVSNMYHDLTIFSLFFYYVFVLVLFEQSDLYINDILKNILIFSLIIMLFDNCVYSNEVYLKKDLEYTSTLSAFTRIIDRMEQTDGYIVGETKVVIIGDLNSSALSTDKRGFDYSGFGSGYNFATTYYTTYSKYLEYVLGYPINLANVEEANKFACKKEVVEMPCFPERGSIELIDNTLVIKLSN